MHSAEIRKFYPFTVLACSTSQFVLQHRALEGSPLWCHKGNTTLSQVGDSTSFQVFVPAPETVSWPPYFFFFFLLPDLWKAHWSFILNRKLTPSIFVEAVNGGPNTLFTGELWNSGIINCTRLHLSSGDLTHWTVWPSPDFLVEVVWKHRIGVHLDAYLYLYLGNWDHLVSFFLKKTK